MYKLARSRSAGFHSVTFWISCLHGYPTKKHSRTIALSLRERPRFVVTAATSASQDAFFNEATLSLFARALSLSLSLSLTHTHTQELHLLRAGLQGYLAHKKQRPPLGPPSGPRHRPTVGF